MSTSDRAYEEVAEDQANRWQIMVEKALVGWGADVHVNIQARL